MRLSTENGKFQLVSDVNPPEVMIYPRSIEACANMLRALTGKRTFYALSLDITADDEGYRFSLRRRGYRSIPVVITGRLRPDRTQTRVILDQKCASAYSWFLYWTISAVAALIFASSGVSIPVGLGGIAVVSVISVPLWLADVAFVQQKAIRALRAAMGKI